jgi:hypothetical protein
VHMNGLSNLAGKAAYRPTATAAKALLKCASYTVWIFNFFWIL